MGNSPPGAGWPYVPTPLCWLLIKLVEVAFPVGCVRYGWLIGTLVVVITLLAFEGIPATLLLEVATPPPPGLTVVYIVKVVVTEVLP